MTSKTKERFYYSEIEDKIIIDSILNDFKNRQSERKSYELTWELNLNFYLGNQYSFITNNGVVGNIEKQFYWENQEVFNHIAPIIEARLSKLNKIKPSLNVKANSSSNKDIYATKLAKSILNSTVEKNSFTSMVSTATAWSEISGTSFYKINWDSSLGNIIGIDENNKGIKNGDVNISVCSPFEIFPSSNSCQEIEDCESIIHARPIPVSTANQTWNLNLDGEDIDICELSTNSTLSGMTGRTDSSKIIHSTKSNHVLVIERYEKPSHKYPDGKLTIICKDKLVYDGPMPYKTPNGEYFYPFVKQVSIKRLASFWGGSVIERCIPIQRSYNAIKNKKHEFITRLTSGVLAVEDGSVDVDNLETEGLAPGKILIYRNGSTPPKFLEAGTIPNELEKEEEKLLEELSTLSSVSDLSSNSRIPGNLNSGSALSLLIEQDNSRMSTTAENIRTAIKNIGYIILNLYKQFANTVRLNKFTDANGTLEVFYWNNNDLNLDDIQLESSNELENSHSDKKELILSLLNKGILEDNTNKLSATTKKSILKICDLENIEISKDTDELHKERASKENLKLISLETPFEIDNHKLHIEEHTRFLISDEGQKLSKEDTQNLLNHIKLHKNFI